MAQKHKAPTQVTLHTEEKGAFAQWIETNWRMMAFAAVLVVGLIVAAQILSARAKAAEDARLETWRQAALSIDPDRLEQAAAELAGEPHASWLTLTRVQLAALEERPEDAAAHLEELRAAESFLLTEFELPLGPEGEERSIVQHVGNALQSSREVHAELPFSSVTPDPPEGSPRVRFVTGLGDFEVALFEEQAPLHVENFLANVDAGVYEGTRFHRVIPGFMVQGGDPNTKQDDRSTWGQGEPDEERVPSEADNGLVHSPFVMAGAKQQRQEGSSQHQFYVTVGGAHWLDGEHTVYGKVLSGRDVLRSMSRLETNQEDQPLEAPLLQRVERL